MSAEKITTITPALTALRVPSRLAALQQWLCWRYETLPGEDKARKVPYYPTGGRRSGSHGSPRDREQLTSFAIAKEQAAKRGMDGIGLAMLPDTGIVALDFDHCIDPATGNVPKDVEDIVSQTYAEYSPSGLGLRAFVLGDVGNHKSVGPRAQGSYGFETFSSNGFVTVTGNAFWTTDLFGNEETIAPMPKAVLDLVDKRFGSDLRVQDSARDPIEAAFNDHEPPLGLSIEEMEGYLAQIDPDVSREEWIRVGMALHHECEGDDTGFDLWDTWSAEGAKYPSTEALRQQWQSFDRRQGSGRKAVTMASVINMAKRAGGERQRSSVDRAALAAEMREAAESAVSDGEPYTGRFPVERAGAVMGRKPPEWLIKGVLPKADLVVLFGASGSGKTFVALDMALCIDRGLDWRGRRTKAGRVVLIAAEGTGGIGNRLSAYCQHHGVDKGSLGLGVISGAPNFLQRDDISDVVASIVASGGADVIIVDTFAQVTPGANENSGEDMGLALSHARALRDATGAVVVLVHHAGKDTSRGARGWSGIRAAADAELEVIRFDTGARMIRTSKQKDGEDGLEWGFALEVVTLGVDDDGDEITSCVAVEAELIKPAPEDMAKPKRKPLGKWAEHVLETIQTFGLDVYEIPLTDLLDKAVDTWPAPEQGERDLRRQHMSRAIKTLAGLKDEAPFAIENGVAVLL